MGSEGIYLREVAFSHFHLIGEYRNGSTLGDEFRGALFAVELRHFDRVREIGGGGRWGGRGHLGVGGGRRVCEGVPVNGPQGGDGPTVGAGIDVARVFERRGDVVGAHHALWNGVRVKGISFFNQIQKKKKISFRSQ